MAQLDTWVNGRLQTIDLDTIWMETFREWDGKVDTDIAEQIATATEAILRRGRDGECRPRPDARITWFMAPAGERGWDWVCTRCGGTQGEGGSDHGPTNVLDDRIRPIQPGEGRADLRHERRG
jgi:hypothetical protein